MPTLKIIWNGRLKPCPRPKAARSGGVYYPSDYKRHLQTLRNWFQAHTERLPLPPHAYYTVRATVYKKTPPESRHYGDIDNLLKTILDMLPFDDACVTSATVSKRRCDRSDQERLELELSFPENRLPHQFLSEPDD